MNKPITLVTGLSSAVMSRSMMALLWDAMDAVAVRHDIDAERSVLTRVVSDMSGELERVEVDLAHACVSCAIREDIVPTLARLTADDRWSAVIAQLPQGAAPDQVCQVWDADRDLRAAATITGVVAALATETLQEDLVGGDLLAERGLHTSEEDRRGVGESVCEILELADTIVLEGPLEVVDHELVGALRAPHAQVLRGPEFLRMTTVEAPRHDLARSLHWSQPVSPGLLASLDTPRVWRTDLCSTRPFHPQRLLEGLAAVGEGRHRSRGCFWLPSRPHDLQVWRGAGGLVSIGSSGGWGRRTPCTRLVLTGVGAAPEHLDDAFRSMLLQPDEGYPPVASDGLERWLGPVRDVA